MILLLPLLVAAAAERTLHSFKKDTFPLLDLHSLNHDYGRLPQGRIFLSSFGRQDHDLDLILNSPKDIDSIAHKRIKARLKAGFRRLSPDGTWVVAGHHGRHKGRLHKDRVATYFARPPPATPPPTPPPKFIDHAATLNLLIGSPSREKPTISQKMETTVIGSPATPLAKFIDDDPTRNVLIGQPSREESSPSKELKSPAIGPLTPMLSKIQHASHKSAKYGARHSKPPNSEFQRDETDDVEFNLPTDPPILGPPSIPTTPATELETMPTLTSLIGPPSIYKAKKRKEPNPLRAWELPKNSQTPSFPLPETFPRTTVAPLIIFPESARVVGEPSVNRVPGLPWHSNWEAKMAMPQPSLPVNTQLHRQFTRPFRSWRQPFGTLSTSSFKESNDVWAQPSSESPASYKKLSRYFWTFPITTTTTTTSSPANLQSLEDRGPLKPWLLQPSLPLDIRRIRRRQRILQKVAGRRGMGRDPGGRSHWPVMSEPGYLFGSRYPSTSATFHHRDWRPAGSRKIDPSLRSITKVLPAKVPNFVLSY